MQVVKIVLSAVLIGMAVTARGAAEAVAYTPAPFSYYQPILDRMPFGLLPPNFDDADLEDLKTPTQELLEQQQVANHLSFSALNITPQGKIAVGFVDRSVNPPASYYLAVGESADDWTVLNANYKENWAQFKHAGLIITMHLEKGLLEGIPGKEELSTDSRPPLSHDAPLSPATGNRTASRHPSPHTRPPATSIRPITPNASATAQAAAPSYLERLRERRDKVDAAKSAAEQATQERLQELARRIAQDEMSKREDETVKALEELKLQQQLFQARQEEELLREQLQEEDEVQELINLPQ